MCSTHLIAEALTYVDVVQMLMMSESAVPAILMKAFMPCFCPTTSSMTLSNQVMQHLHLPSRPETSHIKVAIW